jgi:hypothetical protein
MKFRSALRFMSRPWPLGISVFLACFIIGGQIIGAARCKDGWASGSIGRPGACSHHGGVDRFPGQVRFWLSLAAGIWAGVSRSRAIDRAELASRAVSQPSPAPATATPSETANSVRCPKCHSGMVLRIAKKGRSAGQRFWGCARYPQCKGIRKA